MTASSRARLGLGSLLIAYVVWAGLFVERTSFATPDGRVFSLWDDAMISMHYARNLAEGAGLVWNPGEAPVQGFSNLGVTLVMAALHRLPLSATQVSLAFQLLNLAALVAILILVHRLARSLYPERTAIAAGSVVAVALSGPLAFWALTGSDMGLLTLWLLAGVVAIERAEAGALHGLGLGFVLLGPGLWLRPDALMFYGLLVGAAFLLPQQRRAAWIGVGVAGVFVGGWLLLGVAYYGDPLPNTYYLKATGHPRGLVMQKGLALLWVWLPRLVVPLLLAGVALWQGRSRVVFRLCGAIVLASLAYSVWVGGDWMADHGIRYLVPMLPLVLLLMTAGAAMLIDRLLAVRSQRSRVVSTFAVACGLGVLANAPATLPVWLGTAVPDMVRANRSNYYFAVYVDRHTDASTSLGVHWAGVPVYFSRRPAIDLLGRSDRHIARLEVERFRPGHSKWDWDYVVNQRRPDVLREATRGLDARDDFRRAYVRASKSGRDFFVRRAAIGKLQDPSVALLDLSTGRPTSRAELLEEIGGETSGSAPQPAMQSSRADRPRARADSQPAER